jgi:hypothetical protein
MLHSYTSLCVTIRTQTCYDLALEGRGREDPAACSVAISALGSDEHSMGSWSGNTGTLDHMGGLGHGGLWRQEADLFLIRYAPSSTYSHGLQGLGGTIVTWSYLAQDLGRTGYRLNHIS